MGATDLARQQPDVLAAIPTAPPLLRQVAGVLADAPRGTRLTQGPLAGVIQRINPEKIWIDPLLLVFGEQDMNVLGESGIRFLMGEDAPDEYSEAQDALAEAYNMNVVEDENGQPRLRLLVPLIVAERVCPTNPSRNLLLMVDPQPLFAAKALGWDWVEGIVFGDMPDFTMRCFGLHIKMRQSAPTQFEIWRHARAGERDITEGRCAPGTAGMTKAYLARLLGMTRTYFSKLETAMGRSSEAIDAAVRGEVSVQLAIATTQTLQNAPQLIGGALKEMHTQHMSVTQGVKYLKDLLANASAALRLVGDGGRSTATPTAQPDDTNYGDITLQRLIDLMIEAQRVVGLDTLKDIFAPEQIKELKTGFADYAKFFRDHLSE